MKAMLLYAARTPLVLEEVREPTPNENEIKIQVSYCGICRTDLHIIDGELNAPTLPLILGHQIVGKIVEKGGQVSRFKIGDRVGVPWLGGSCGKCIYCSKGKENLCDNVIYTGYQKNGGFAEYTVANADFCFPLPQNYSDRNVAPLLCAGLIGYRTLKFTEGAHNVGFYGFGSAAHILIQVVNYNQGKVFAFTKEGDFKGQQFAKELGAFWAGSINDTPPELLDAAILFAPVGELAPLALKNTRKGGVVVSAGIHMSDIPSFPYSLLWGERVLRSVANLTRQDGREFLTLAPKIPLVTQTTKYPLEKLNEAFEDLRSGKFFGSAVIKINTSL